MPYAWIKLYTEILSDPKMGRLPDYLWRRAVELFLLAGKEGNDGALPPVSTMGWELRLEESKLVEHLIALSAVGVVHEAEPGKWVVTNFTKRQASMTDMERKRKQRSQDKSTNPVNQSRFGNKSQSCHARVTEEEEEVEEDSSTGGGSESPNVFELYQENFGNLTPMISDQLKDMEITYTPEWVISAMREALSQEARKLAYVEAILKRWTTDGFQSRKKVGKNDKLPEKPKPRPAPAQPAYSEADRVAAAAILRRKAEQAALIAGQT